MRLLHSAAALSKRARRWSRLRRKLRQKQAAVCWSRADTLPGAPRIDNPNTHGTGCTLSSAIACGLAQGISLPGSVKRAKRYLTACIRFGLNLGHGSGPLQHKIEWDE